MSDELLPFYNRELEFIRTSGEEFAKKYPRIAGRLQLTSTGSQDPHVERLLEGFAYLCARIRHKLSDDFPEITDALLNILYPHFVAPTPSMGIVEFQLDRAQGELTGGYEVPRHTAVETEPVDGERCRFRTCYPIRLWPFEVQSAALLARPFAAPSTPRSAGCPGALHIQLSAFSRAVPFDKFKCDSLRFFLHAGQAQNAFKLYELLFSDSVEIVLAASPNDPRPIVLDKRSLRPVGFARDEGMVPYSARSFLGYRLMTELFSFPEKFLFFDLADVDLSRLQGAQNNLHIYVFLDRTAPELAHTVSRESLRLGCAPVVNLFPLRADPFVLAETQTEYRIIPDARRPLALEIYSIDDVAATSPDGDQVKYAPFYSFKHAADRADQQTFWYATRKQSSRQQEGVDADPGTEMYLSLVDLAFSPRAPANHTIELQLTCTNRELPRRLPFGGGRPELDLPDGRGPIVRIACVTPFTPTLRPPLRERALWRVISHLSLNHLSLADAEEGTLALREILKLYNVSDAPAARDMVQGVLEVASQRVVGRIGGGAGGFCRGLELRLLLDEEKFLGSGVYLFSAVLDRFLGLYVSINSFSKLVATTKQRQGQREPWRWPLRAGERILL